MTSQNCSAQLQSLLTRLERKSQGCTLLPNIFLQNPSGPVCSQKPATKQIQNPKSEIQSLHVWILEFGFLGKPVSISEQGVGNLAGNWWPSSWPGMWWKFNSWCPWDDYEVLRVGMADLFKSGPCYAEGHSPVTLLSQTRTLQRRKRSGNWEMLS